jgi:hypothetical protein
MLSLSRREDDLVHRDFSLEIEPYGNNVVLPFLLETSSSVTKSAIDLIQEVPEFNLNPPHDHDDDSLRCIYLAYKRASQHQIMPSIATWKKFGRIGLGLWMFSRDALLVTLLTHYGLGCRVRNHGAFPRHLSKPSIRIGISFPFHGRPHDE